MRFKNIDSGLYLDSTGHFTSSRENAAVINDPVVALFIAVLAGNRVSHLEDNV